MLLLPLFDEDFLKSAQYKMGRGSESTIIRKKSALSPSPLPLCGIPTSISFVKEERDKGRGN
jgi:hypothetical protein